MRVVASTWLLHPNSAAILTLRLAVEKDGKKCNCANIANVKNKVRSNQLLFLHIFLKNIYKHFHISKKIFFFSKIHIRYCIKFHICECSKNSTFLTPNLALLKEKRPHFVKMATFRIREKCKYGRIKMSHRFLVYHSGQDLRRQRWQRQRCKRRRRRPRVQEGPAGRVKRRRRRCSSCWSPSGDWARAAVDKNGFTFYTIEKEPFWRRGRFGTWQFREQTCSILFSK